MEILKNENGVPEYPRSDGRRLLILLAAIDKLERPTLTTLAAFTGHNKGTIDADIVRLREQFGVLIEKESAVYRIKSWGEILRKAGVRQVLEG